MLNAGIEQKATDGLNLRLSIALNTAVPFMLFGMILGRNSSDAITTLSWIAFGLVGYSLVEYVFHRWVLHHLVTDGHQRHHTEPFAPFALPFSAGLTVHTAMLGMLSLGVGLDRALLITLGSSIGYAIFAQIHELIHRDPILARRLIPQLQRHHMLHHRAGPAGEEHNFGVSTTFWDRLFGTYCR